MATQHNKAARVFAKTIQREWKPLTQDDYRRIRKAEAEASGIEFRHRDCRGTLLRVGDVVTFTLTSAPQPIIKGTIETLCAGNTKAAVVTAPEMTYPKTIPTTWILSPRSA